MKKILDLIVEFGNVAPAVAAAESAVGKAIALSPVVNELTSLLTLDMAGLSSEYAKLTEADKVNLFEYAKKKYDIADDILEQKVERGLELAFEVWKLGREIAEYAKEIKQ